MDIFACNWEGRAGACWECWKLEPCCGDPCNPLDGVRCYLCWVCPIVNCASSFKLYAHSQDQDCAVVNHFLPFIIDCVTGLPFASTTMRHNLRTKFGRSPAPMDPSGLVGDAVMMWCCGACSMCQMLRSVDKESWDWIKEVNDKGIKPSVEPCIFCRS
eukprot:TRINITY_DN3889_c0_g2_i1.p2 TRINITY_DN3889_c0_g2~~TRINITY_DN3889_c0_g2_i1.p2  ORF type:complete len:158 (+),score=39.16 TRINITY_DN3889_c0_g2_i1:25-498(+)